jgi:aquaporin Z
VDMRKVVAELVGTFVFFAFGLMAFLSTISMNGPDLVVIALAFGLGLFAAIQIGGAISGGHFNPAVTVAAVLDGRLDWMNGVGYVIAQVVGGLAAAVLVLAASSQAEVAQTITKPGHGLSDVQALGVEAVFTAIFVAVILTVTRNLPQFASVAIPATLVVIHLALVPFTGASVNPARSIASAVIGGDLIGLWIYIVGPIIGAIVGLGVYRGMGRDMVILGMPRPK